MTEQNPNSQRVRVNLPAGFTDKMRPMVEAKVSERFGGTFVLQSVDSAKNLGVFVKEYGANTTIQSGIEGKLIALSAKDCQGTGERAAAKIAEDFPGYTMYRFEPHLSRALIVKMDEQIIATRAAVATALGVKPWDVVVRHRDGGGFLISNMPASYVPSKHDDKLLEAAQTKVPGGKPGWFVKTDPQDLTAQIIPAELPTFPETIPAPLGSMGADVNRSYFGLKLPEPGQQEHTEAFIDWTATHGLIVGGLPGGGKRQPMYAPIPVPASAKFPTGWARMKDLAPGDHVYTINGNIARIKGESETITRPTYRFFLNDGQALDFDDQHFCLASTHQDRTSGVSPTAQALETYRDSEVKVEAPDAAELFGLPLSFVEGSFFDKQVRLRDVAELISPLFVRDKTFRIVEAGTIAASLHLHWAFPLCAPTQGAEHPGANLEAGRNLKTHNATLSPELLRSGPKGRLKILRGIMEGAEEGSLGERFVTLTSMDAAKQCLELARSLGFFAFLDPPGTPRVGVVGPHDFTRSDGAGPAVRGTLYNIVTGGMYLGETPGKCIQVEDPTSTYLTAGFVPTHNTVTINNILYDQIASGAEIVIIDTLDKSVDFMWARDFVRPGGWGCENLRESVAALALAYEEGRRRAEIVRNAGVAKWLDLPESERFKPITIFIDEYSALSVTDKVPTALPKEHPLRIEVEEANTYKTQIASYVTKILAEQRSHGNRILLSTQVTNAATGVPPTLRTKFGGKILQGTRASDAARGQILTDPKAAPTPPEYLAQGQVSRGISVAEIEGQKAVVCKSYFSTVQQLLESLEARGIPKQTRNIRPSAQAVTRFAPSVYDEQDLGSPPPGMSKQNAGKASEQISFDEALGEFLPDE